MKTQWLALLVAPASLLLAGDADLPLPFAPLRDAFARSAHSDTFRQYWEDYHETTKGGRTLRSGEPAYPTEPAIVFLSAWLCTGEEKYRQAYSEHFTYAHSRENDDGLLVANDGFGRDLQARQIYNFYTAYKLTGDKRYLAWADHCAHGMLKHLVRRSHQIRGRTLTTFVAGICPAQKPYRSSDLHPWVDVNQNAEVALAFTLLYHEPRSELHRMSQLVALVRDEMEAGLAIQNTETGAIPLAESPDRVTQYDTAYGSYGLFSWVWLNTYWKNPAWKERIKLAGRWISGYSRGDKGFADRFYPSRGRYLASWDLWYRIPVLWQLDFKPDAMIDYYVTRQAPISDVGDRAFLLFAYFELMRIPPRFYLP